MEKSIFEATEMAALYHQLPGNWLLLEVLETDAKGQALKLKLINYSNDKDSLRDYLMEDADWNWNKKYIFVLADPNKPCELQ